MKEKHLSPKYFLGEKVYYFCQQKLKEGIVIGVCFKKEEQNCRYEVQETEEPKISVFMDEKEFFPSKEEAVKDILNKNNISYKGICQWLLKLDKGE